jgi:hypothetical protein
MTTVVDTTTPESRRRISSAGWAGVLGAPAIWGAQQEAMYALTQWVCLSGNYAVLVVITIACLIGAAVCGFVSWRTWRRSGGESPDDTDGGAIARSRFLGALGVITSVMFFLLILAQGIPTFFFDACWT